MSKGQVQLGMLAIVGVVSFGASWLGNYVLNSPAQSQAQIADNKTDVAVLKSSQLIQDAIIAELKDDVKYTRRLVEQMATKQGIKLNQ